ncbi:MAG: CPBP family glutamic-type intramembrane protease, partial [Lentisphaeraceae bacterium]|nr:CPBP family glutamic-type intramembrane protease [Lentisphaeraceae bacterium]
MDIIKKAFQGFVKRLPFILLINTAMLVLLLLLFLIMGTESFSPYIKSLAGQILSVKDVFIFLSLFAVVGFTIELVLRKFIQERILTAEKKWSKAGAIAVPTLCCLLLHLYFGVTGLIYGLLCGLLLSVLFLMKKDWLTFALWGMCWGFIIVPFSMGTCVFVDGQVRNDFLFA